MVRGDIGQLSRDPVSGAYNWASLNIESFKFSGLDYTDWHPVQVIKPYLSTLPQYQNFKSAYGTGVSHVYRIWNEDLNHDGKQDLLAAESMWTGVFNGKFPTALQLLINVGGDFFRDMTLTLNPDIGYDYNEGDYSPEFVDLDRSGINALIFAGNMDLGSSIRKPNFVLLNDGTGRIYVGMHDQFATLSQKLDAHLAAHGLPSGQRLLKIGRAHV